MQNQEKPNAKTRCVGFGDCGMDRFMLQGDVKSKQILKVKKHAFKSMADKVESIRVGKWLFCDIIIYMHRFELTKSDLILTP